MLDLTIIEKVLQDAINSPYVTIFCITFFIGLLKACHDLMQKGFQKSAVEAMLIATLMTIFSRSLDLAGHQLKYDAMLLLATSIGYLGIRHTDLMIKALLKTVLIPIDKVLGTKLVDILNDDEPDKETKNDKHL